VNDMRRQHWRRGYSYLRPVNRFESVVIIVQPSLCNNPRRHVCRGYYRRTNGWLTWVSPYSKGTVT
jgi:hypothetical protein